LPVDPAAYVKQVNALLVWSFPEDWPLCNVVIVSIAPQLVAISTEIHSEPCGLPGWQGFLLFDSELAGSPFWGMAWPASGP